MAVTANGTFTTKVRLGAKTVVPAAAKKAKAGSAMAALHGGIVDHVFTGVLKEPTGS